MADQNFSDIQAQMRNQMQSQGKESELKDAVTEMNSATKNLNSTNVNQLQQSNALIQTLQQTQLQIQTLASNIQNLTNQQRMNSLQQPVGASPPPPPVPARSPMMAGLGGVAHTGLGMVKTGAQITVGAASNKAEQFRQSASGANARYNPFGVQAQIGSTSGLSVANGGVMTLQNQGLKHSMMAASGAFWNPTLSQSYTAGQYQAAGARNVGQNIQDIAGGAMAGAASALSFENAGAFGGSALGGYVGGAMGMALGPAGAVVGGMIGSQIGGQAGASLGQTADIINPIQFGVGHMQRTAMYGSRANEGAESFLRMGGGSTRRGQFDLTQQARIGQGMSRDALKDLTFTSQDMTDMQEQFASKGLNLGVNNGREYRQNFQKRMSDAKEIMKMFNLSLDEATDFMEEEFSQRGANAGATGSRVRMLAAAHASGISPMQMAKIANAGAGQAGQFGLMASAGSSAAVQAQQLAGISAHMGGRNGMGVGTDLLSSVGGEQGLQQLLQQQMMKFMGGTGGTLMALNKGSFGTDVMGALQNAGSGLTQDRMMSFAANRHKELSQFADNPGLVQAQQFMMLKGLAGQLKGSGGTEEERMMLLAQGQGMSSAQADAFIQSGKALPAALEQQMADMSQGRTDMVRDHRAENFGIRGRVERAFRGTAVVGGALNLADRGTSYAAELGQRGEVAMQEITDKLYGIEGVAGYTEEGTARIRKQGLGGFIEEAADPATRKRRQEMANIRRSAKAEFGDKSAVGKRAGEMLGDLEYEIDEVANPMLQGGREFKRSNRLTKKSMSQIKRAVQAIKTGDSTDFYAKLKSGEGPTPAEIMEVLNQSGADKDTIHDVATAFGFSEDAKSGKKVKTPEQIANRGREMFLGEKAGLGDKLVSDESWMHAMDSTEFKEFMKLVDRMYSVRKRDRSPGSSESRGISKEYDQLKAAVKSKFASITDGKVKEVIETVLKKRGITITPDGNIDMGKATSVNPDAAGLFENSFEVGLSGVTSDIDSSRKSDAMKNTLGRLGISESVLGETGSIQDYEGVQAGLQIFADSNSEKMNEFASGNQYQRYIAAAAKKVQGGGKLTDAHMKKLSYAMGMEGVTATTGGVVQTDVDGSMMGAKTLEGMDKVNASLDATQKMLKILATANGLPTK